MLELKITAILNPTSQKCYIELQSIKRIKEISEMNVWSLSENEHLHGLNNQTMCTKNKYIEVLLLWF